MQILSVCGVLPEHRYSQEEITDAFAGMIAQGGFDEWVLRQFHRNAGVRQRNLVLPLEAHGQLEDFTQANGLFIENAVELGARAVVDALKVGKRNKINISAAQGSNEIAATPGESRPWWRTVGAVIAGVVALLLAMVGGLSLLCRHRAGGSANGPRTNS
jgi:hypothetical protein